MSQVTVTYTPASVVLRNLWDLGIVDTKEYFGIYEVLAVGMPRGRGHVLVSAEEFRKTLKRLGLESALPLAPLVDLLT